MLQCCLAFVSTHRISRDSDSDIIGETDLFFPNNFGPQLHGPRPEIRVGTFFLVIFASKEA
jgi:hypothetical protein